MSFLRHAGEKKCTPPDETPAYRKARGLIPRPALLLRLADVRSTRCTYIQAPAGYGKSSLLQQWRNALRAEGAMTITADLEANQRIPRQLLDHLAVAIEAQSKLSPQQIMDETPADALPASVAAQLARVFEKAPDPTFLMLDDVHLVSGAGAVRCLRAFIEHAPPQLHIVLSTREALNLPLARWRALGEITEITTRDLRFSSAETDAIFAQAGHTGLGSDALRTVEERSEGWAVGLRLAALALSYDHADLQRSLSGERNEIFDFFAEDVFAAQSEAVREFLLQISILEKFSASLCNAITGRKDGRDMLGRCEKAGLFLVPLDDSRTWYRFHTMFREFLVRARAEHYIEDAALLHDRASIWFSESGMFTEAFEHAVRSNDMIRAAGLLERHLDSILSAGQINIIPGLAAKIPAHIQAFHPRVMLAAAWSMAMHWKFPEVQNLLSASRTRIADMENLGNTPKEDLQGLKHLLAHREMMLALFQDNMPTVERQGTALMADYRNAHPFVLGSISSAFLRSQCDQFKLNNVEYLDSTASEQLARCEGRQVHIAHEAVAGITRFAIGESEAAIARLRNGLEIAESIWGRNKPHGAMTALPLAEVLYERNEVDDAQMLLERYLPVAGELGFVDQLISGWLTHSRIMRLRGDGEGALRDLNTANALAAQHGFKRLALAASEERVRQMLRSGRCDDAARAARRAGIANAPNSVMPTDTVTARDEVLALMWVNWAETRDRIADALKVARVWRNLVANAGALRSVIRWDIRIADLLLLSGDQRSAKRTLRRAVSLAAPGRYMRSFLDEPALLGTLFSDEAREDRAGDDAAAVMAELLREHDRERGREPVVDEFPESSPRYLSGVLNSQELEVLKLAASGLNNREMGDRMGLSEGSIKWHLQQVYNKIGVRRRMLAIERARVLGFIR